MSALRHLAAGALAGGAGTAAMDLLLYRRYRREGGKDGIWRWESAEGVTTWDEASAPGRLGQKVERFVMGRSPPERLARATTNLVHWATGAGWGLVRRAGQAYVDAGLAAGTRSRTGGMAHELRGAAVGEGVRADLEVRRPHPREGLVRPPRVRPRDGRRVRGAQRRRCRRWSSTPEEAMTSAPLIVRPHTNCSCSARWSS